MQTGKADYHTPNPIGFAIRMMLLVLLAVLFFSLLSEYLSERVTAPKARDLSGDTSFYDHYYYDKQYGALRDLLYLDDVPDDGGRVYGKYWEVVHACEHCIAAQDYAAGAKAGLDYAAELAEEELAALQSMAAQPAFPENAGLLRQMLEQAMGSTG